MINFHFKLSNGKNNARKDKGTKYLPYASVFNMKIKNIKKNGIANLTQVCMILLNISSFELIKTNKGIINIKLVVIKFFHSQ